MTRLRFSGLVGAVLSSLAALGPASAEPLKIKLGIGSAVEEQVWLLVAKPELAPNYGKAYTMEWTRFPGADKRVQAFEAGAEDIITSSANGAILAASEGIAFKMIASLSRESQRGFYTKFMVRADSPIRTVADLKGKTIGMNGFSGSGHLWTKVVLEQNGLSESDVKLVPLPFPAQGEALKSGTIQVGMFPQPFAQIMETQGNVRTLYTSKDAAPFEEELMVLLAKRGYIEKNRVAVDALLSDLVTVTKYYEDHPEEARTALIATQMVRVDPKVYIPMQDYYRDPTVRMDLAALEQMQALQMKAGFQTMEVDLKCRVDVACAER